MSPEENVSPVLISLNSYTTGKLSKLTSMIFNQIALQYRCFFSPYFCFYMCITFKVFANIINFNISVLY